MARMIRPDRRRRAPRIARPFLVPLLVAMVAAGCVPASNLPESCDDDAVTLQATLVEERLEPSSLEVCRGPQVTIELSVERDATFPIHGYDEEVPARQVIAGEDVTLEFEAARAGQFPIAIHTTDGPAEATVGTLIVHEG
jgi:hypothetical protein